MPTFNNDVEIADADLILVDAADDEARINRISRPTATRTGPDRRVGDIG